MKSPIIQYLLTSIVVTDPKPRILKYIRNRSIKFLDAQLNDRREFSRDKFESNVKRLKSWSPLVFITLFIFICGIEFKQYSLQDTLWEYRSMKFELVQKSAYNATLQQQISDLIKTKDYLRYKVFESSNVLIPKHVPTEHIMTMLEQSDRYHIPKDIYFKLIERESRFNPNAKSHKSAKGYMQIMPATYNQYAMQLNIKGQSPVDNIKVGSFMLADLFQFWSRTKSSDTEVWKLTLASYNAGLGAVQRAGGVPNYEETQRYVKYIMSQN